MPLDEEDDRPVPLDAFGTYASGESADVIHVEGVDRRPRCRNPDCRKTLAFYAGRPWRIQCDRCKVVNHAE